MASLVVLVNGLPGSGKTSLAAPLAAALDMALLSKDAVKEALADAVLPGLDPALAGRLTSTFGGVAMDAVWSIAARLDGGVVVDSWWFLPRDRRWALDGLRRSGAAGAVEVWCDVPAGLARARYESRRRHAVHQDAVQSQWPQWAASAQPLGIGSVVRVNSALSVDATVVARQVRRTPEASGWPPAPDRGQAAGPP